MPIYAYSTDPGKRTSTASLQGLSSSRFLISYETEFRSYRTFRHSRSRYQMFSFTLFVSKFSLSLIESTKIKSTVLSQNIFTLNQQSRTLKMKTKRIKNKFPFWKFIHYQSSLLILSFSSNKKLVKFWIIQFELVNLHFQQVYFYWYRLIIQCRYFEFFKSQFNWKELRFSKSSV